MMSDIKKQRQLDATNSKLPSGLGRPPAGRPPISGAQVSSVVKSCNDYMVNSEMSTIAIFGY